MKREQGPPEDDLAGAGLASQDELSPAQDAARREVLDSVSSQAAPGRRKAHGTDAEVRDDYSAPESLIEQFLAQYSPELMESLCRYAARRMSGALKLSATDYLAKELAQDAVDDTLDGGAPWTPEPGTLERHLRNIVKRRILATLDRAKRLPHVSIDAIAPDGRAFGRDEMEHAMRTRYADTHTSEYARHAVSEMRLRVAQDADALAIFDAKANGATGRTDIMAVTGLSQHRYRSALRRLNQIAHELGLELHLGRHRKKRT